jgi:hypothetical protein
MMKRASMVAVVLSGLLAWVGLAQDSQHARGTTTTTTSSSSRDGNAVSEHYRALKYPAPASQGTWAILDFDGAHRNVEPYLSSLAGGELGTGRIVSPPFVASVEEITFTVCGHDGQGGGQESNFVALVDAQTDSVLRKTTAPGADPMQERSWDVGELRGRPLRIEVHDGLAATAFAWIGVGRIDAGPSLRVDFSEGMPEGWHVIARPEEDRIELVPGGVPFRRRPAVYSLVPAQGACEIPCGFRAERLFFLGGTVASGNPLETYGHIEIVYREGPTERYPLTFGYTLDEELKLPSRSKPMYLHPSGDVFQRYLVVGPRSEVIEKIVLRKNPEHDVLPRITAVTCETSASSEHLAPLPDCRPDDDEAAWIESHTITADSPNVREIAAEIRRAHKM